MTRGLEPCEVCGAGAAKECRFDCSEHWTNLGRESLGLYIRKLHASLAEHGDLLARIAALEEGLGIAMSVYEDVCNDHEKSKERRDALQRLLAARQ